MENILHRHFACGRAYYVSFWDNNIIIRCVMSAIPSARRILGRNLKQSSNNIGFGDPLETYSHTTQYWCTDVIMRELNLRLRRLRGKLRIGLLTCTRGAHTQCRTIFVIYVVYYIIDKRRSNGIIIIIVAANALGRPIVDVSHVRPATAYYT